MTIWHRVGLWMRNRRRLWTRSRRVVRVTPMLKSQLSWVCSQHPQYIRHSGICGAADEAVVNVVLKNPKILQFLFGLQVFWENNFSWYFNICLKMHITSRNFSFSRHQNTAKVKKTTVLLYLRFVRENPDYGGSGSVFITSCTRDQADKKISRDVIFPLWFCRRTVPWDRLVLLTERVLHDL